MPLLSPWSAVHAAVNASGSHRWRRETQIANNRLVCEISSRVKAHFLMGTLLGKRRDLNSRSSDRATASAPFDGARSESPAQCGLHPIELLAPRLRRDRPATDGDVLGDLLDLEAQPDESCCLPLR